MEKVRISDNFHGLTKWRNLLASFNCNENGEKKKCLFLFETYWRAFIVVISERVFLKKEKVFYYGEGTKDYGRVKSE